MRTGFELSHLIEEAWGFRSRVMYDKFDPLAVARLLTGSGVGEEPGSGTTAARVTIKGGDTETVGGPYDADLDLGTADGAANGVGVRFTGLALPAAAEIDSAYFVFTASGDSAAGGSLKIELQQNLTAGNYATGAGLNQRTYGAATVNWDDIGAWETGKTYQSADISALIEALIADGGLATSQVLAFRITGSGAHAAHAFDGLPSGAPQLVIDYGHDLG